MTASTRSAEDESRDNPDPEQTAITQPSESVASDPAASSSSVSLVGTTDSERCTTCSAEMAGDQSYCVECGTRRGRPRFAAPVQLQKRSETALATRPAESRFGSATTTIALGIVIALLALGVGFLIGNSSETVKVVNGGAPAATGGSAAAKSGKTPATAKTTTSFSFGS